MATFFIKGNQYIQGASYQTQAGVETVDLANNYQNNDSYDFVEVQDTESFANNVIDNSIDLTRVKPIGVYFNMIGGTLDRMNRVGSVINPTKALVQQYTQSFGNSLHMFYEKTYNTRSLIYKNYVEYFESACKEAIDWLCPEVNSGLQSDYCSFFQFHIPHGKVYEIPPFGYKEAKDTEFDALADNFYERCAALRKMGIITQAHHGSPEHFMETKSPGDTKLAQAIALHEKANMGFGFDASTIYKSGGITWNTMLDLNTKYHAYMEGLVPYTGQSEWSYMYSPMMLVSDATAQRLGYGKYYNARPAFANGVYPDLATSSGNSGVGSFWHTYSGHTIFIQLEETEFDYLNGPTSGLSIDASDPYNGLLYCSGYMSGVRQLSQQFRNAMPANATCNVKLLIPYTIVSRIVQRTYHTGATNPRQFLSPQQFTVETY